jgi:hypothetical protein
MTPAFDDYTPLRELPAAIPTVPIFRFSVEQYEEMGRQGILKPENRVELLEGWLVPKMTKNPPHAVATKLVSKTFDRLLPPGWHSRTQDPIRLVASVPEPDVAIARGEERDYRERHPNSSEISIVVEVADSSLSEDRTLKKQIYAAAGIPIYWILNLLDNQLEVYTNPTGPAEQPDYQQRQDFGPEDEVPVALDAREVARLKVWELLP